MLKTINTLLLILAVVIGNQAALAALSVSASVSPNPTTINHPVSVSLAVNNTGSQLTVTNIKLTATSTQAPSSSRLPVAFSVYNQNSPLTVGANATTTISGGQVIFFSPSTGITGSGSGTYSIGGLVYTSDGSITPISAAGVSTINPIPLPLNQRQ